MDRKQPGEKIYLLEKIAMGITSGAIAITVANPADMIKVRLQSDSKSNPRYSGFIDAGKKIIKKEGVGSFY